MLTRFWYAILIAVEFLTRIPVGEIPHEAYADKGLRRMSIALFPVVGVVVGAAGASAAVLARAAGLPYIVSGVIAIAVTAGLTGALHEDGLADVCDSLGAHTRAKALEIMRDSRLGTFGAIGLWVALTIQACAISALPDTLVWQYMIVAHVMSRWSSIPLVMSLPSARPESGLGRAAVAAQLTWAEAAPSTLFVALLCGLLLGPLPMLTISVSAVVVVVVTGAAYKARFGGITGDCLGATNQIAQITILLIGAV